MQKIVLPDPLREPFSLLANAVLTAFPDGVVALGGGSLLQAVWSHRTSTDLDLFIAPANLASAFDSSRGYLYPSLLGALTTAGIVLSRTNRTTGRERVFLSGECQDGTPWSLAEFHFMDPHRPMIDTVEGTGIRAASVTEIMMGKIVGRAHARTDAVKAPIPIRDCYDICVCAAREPQILQRILEVLEEGALQRIAENFRNMPRDLHSRDTKPVIDPRWLVPLDNIAPAIGEALASKNLRRIPVATPMQSRRPMPSWPGTSP